MSLTDALEPPPVAHWQAESAEPLAAIPVTVIERTSGWRMVDWRELWKYRELLCFLIWRDVKVRYKQTVLGGAWAILQPFATMVVFSLFFGRAAGLGTGSLPYPIFVYAGLLPWIFFANAVTQASQSVVASQELVTKIYFPRLFLPWGAVGAGLVDFGVAFAMLLSLMGYYRVVPDAGVILVPVVTLLLILLAVGVGSLLAALTVAYRDFRHVIPFMVQLWMFATPAIYLRAADRLPPHWERLLPLNPVYGLIFNFRAAMLGTSFNWYALAVSTGLTLGLLYVAGIYFRQVERKFADII
jgi:lipopolysaccharide transport system permease protein